MEFVMLVRVNSGVWSRVKGYSVRIGEIANRSGVTVDTVRFYERLGVLPSPEREPSGYRDYAPETVERIQLTRELQAIGFTLNEVIDALAAHDAGGATCESERWRLDAVLERVDAKLAELDALRGRIVEAREECAGGRCRFTTLTTSG
jgi:DNA-binding transcriptional MerR regulator